MDMLAGYFSYLPPDCVHDIFDRLGSSDLNAASLTCQYFNMFASERVYELHFDSHMASTWSSSLSHMLRRFRNVKGLSFSNLPKNLINETLYVVAHSGLNIEVLCLPGRENEEDPFPVQQLMNISSRLVSLKSINSSYLVLDDDELSQFARIFNNIEGLDMSWSAPYLTNEGFENASRMLHNLQRIDISFINSLSDSWLVSLSNHCPLLKEVTCICSIHQNMIREGAVCQLLRGCSTLSRVVLGDVFFNMVHFPLAQAVYESECLRYMVINYVVMVDKNHQGEPSSAAQIKAAFLDAWEEEHGIHYFLR